MSHVLFLNHFHSIVKVQFGNWHESTMMTTERLTKLLLHSNLCDNLPTHGDNTITIISFTFVLLKKSLPENCRQTKKIMRMILRRILKTLPSNLDFHKTPIEQLLIPPIMYQHRQPHIGVREFSFAVDMMLARCLRGEIRVSFSEIVHALYVIQSNMRDAYEKYSIMALEILREEERRSWRAFDLGCGCPSRAHEIDCIIAADENLEEFQQRFLYFIERCCFIFSMLAKRTFSRLE
jgi:hypothetical protein